MYITRIGNTMYQLIDTDSDRIYSILYHGKHHTIAAVLSDSVLIYIDNQPVELPLQTIKQSDPYISHIIQL